MKQLLGFLLFVTATVGAQVMDVAHVGRPLDSPEAGAVWSRIEGEQYNTKSAPVFAIEDLPFPQAPGVVQVVREADSGLLEKVSFISTTPLSRMTVTARLVTPRGEVIHYPVFEIVSQREVRVFMELWSGRFPGGWLGGQTRFEVFMLIDGRVTKAAAFAGHGDPSRIGPRLGNITHSFSDSRLLVTVPGQFKPGFITATIGFFPAQEVSVSPTGTLTLAFPANAPLFEGEVTLTVCTEGVCGTRTFYYSPPLGPPGLG